MELISAFVRSYWGFSVLFRLQSGRNLPKFHAVLDTDILRMTPAKLAAAARFLGLVQRGKRGVWVMRKSVCDPRTHTERPCKFSTRTADLKAAVLRASQRWETHEAQVLGASHLPTLGNSGGWASLESIALHYERAASCSPSTRTKNLARLEAMLRDLYPDKLFADLGAEALDGRAVRIWQLARKEQAERDHLPNDPAGCEQAKRGANAQYRQARSVFSAAMLRSYADAGLRLPPGVAEFARQGFLPAGKAPKSRQLSPEVVAKIARLLPRLRTVRPGTYAACVLMFSGALRNCECEAARWDWFHELASGDWQLDLQAQGTFKPKTDESDTPFVIFRREVVEALRSVQREGDPHLVPAATDFQRHELCTRGLNKFLRACGVESIKGKVAYRLRGHAITAAILANGMRAGQELARHTSAKTTELYLGAAVPYAPLGMPQGVGAAV